MSAVDSQPVSTGEACRNKALVTLRGRKMTLPPPEVYELITKDACQILLTRYPQKINGRKGGKGPVLVVHGGSVSSKMFTLPTVKKNFVHFLYDAGYDIWLLDWRVSINLPVWLSTLGDAAKYDFPKAAEFIREQTHKDSIQAVVHCIGSLAFFISVQRGWVKNVRSIAASAVALHPIVGTVERAKTAIHLAAQLRRLGMTEVSPLADPMYPLYSLAVRAMVDSVHHECTSTVCHKLTFMYGHTFLHDALNLETHERLAEQFGTCNLQTLMHVEQCINLGHLADYDYGIAGNLERYGSEVPPSCVDNADNFKNVKIRLISGECNQLFLPPSTEATLQWLKSKNPKGDYDRVVIKGHGHWDVFAGANSDADCYPEFLL
jgi:pimeloyl-ACP methyl ester carboxylesterase